VEDVAPTHVVITFPSAKTVSASDFTIAGFTVLSGSWSGVVYTLVLSVAVVYGNTLNVVYKGKSYPVTNNVITTSEYLTVKAAMTTPPSAADQVIQNKWVYDLKQAGVWNKAILLDNFACPDSQSSLINWKSPGTFTPSLYNTPAFNPYKGFKGNSIIKSNILTNFVSSVNGAGILGQDNMTIITGISTDIIENFDDLSEGDKIFISNLVETLSCMLNGGLQLTLSIISNRYFSLSREVAGTLEINKNLVSLSFAKNSTGLSSTNIRVCGSWNNEANNKIMPFSLIFTYLTPTERQLVIEACDNYLFNYNNHIRRFQIGVKLNTVLEGHSFITSGSYIEDALIGKTNVVNNFAASVSGSTVADIVSRGSAVDTHLIAETSTYKNWLVLWIGVNDIGETAGQGTITYNALKPYLQARSAAGWKVAIFTMTPATAGGDGAQFEIERGIFNGLLRTDASLISNVYILDTDTLLDLNDSTDTLYYVDLMHLTALGAKLAGTLFADKINILYPDTRIPAIIPAQNIITYSEEMDNIVYNKVNITVDTNLEYDLDGSQTLDRITTSNVGHGLYDTITVTPSTVYRLSFDVKRGTMTDLKWCIRDQVHTTDILPTTSFYSKTSGKVVRRLSLEFSTLTNSTSIRVYILRDSGVTGTVFIGRVQVEKNGSAYAKTTNTNIP
jgi:hypothetical protein